MNPHTTAVTTRFGHKAEELQTLITSELVDFISELNSIMTLNRAILILFITAFLYTSDFINESIAFSNAFSVFCAEYRKENKKSTSIGIQTSPFGNEIEEADPCFSATNDTGRAASEISTDFDRDASEDSFDLLYTTNTNADAEPRGTAPSAGLSFSEEEPAEEPVQRAHKEWADSSNSETEATPRYNSGLFQDGVTSNKRGQLFQDLTKSQGLIEQYRGLERMAFSEDEDSSSPPSDSSDDFSDLRADARSSQATELRSDSERYESEESLPLNHYHVTPRPVSVNAEGSKDDSHDLNTLSDLDEYLSSEMEMDEAVSIEDSDAGLACPLI